MGAQRGSLTSEGASKGLLGRREPGWKGVLNSKGPARRASGGPSGLPGERLGLQGACRKGILDPRGLPGGRLGPQRPANRGSKGEKWPILVTVSVSRGPRREPLCPEASENPENS